MVSAALGITEATSQPRASVSSSERGSSTPCRTKPASNAEVPRFASAERVDTDDFREVGDAPGLRHERVELRRELEVVAPGLPLAGAEPHQP
jgi:hypothetical protein